MGSSESQEGLGKAKCKVLHLGWGKPQYQYRLGVEGIESSSAKKKFGELVDEGLDMSCQCAPAAQKAKCVLGHIKRIMVSRLREVYSARLLSFHEIPPGILYLQLCNPQRRKDIDCWSKSRGEPQK